MSNPRLVLVVGAGASNEVKLPLGSDLKTQIANYLNIKFEHGFTLVSGDESIVEALRFRARATDDGRGDINPYLSECRKIASAMPQAASIDNFLDAHSKNEIMIYCGKLAIARAILSAEKASSLSVDNRIAISTA